MKRTNAIIAAVVAIVIIVGAVGAIILMNPGTNSSTTGGGDTDTILPSGDEGTVNSLIIDVAGTNDSNASSLSDLMPGFNSTSGGRELPDALAFVAVTNNRTDNITLDCSNFTATLENDSEVQALNTRNVSVGPNITVFLVLGFKTDGMNITDINYDDGNISFNSVWRKTGGDRLSDPVIEKAPTGELNATDNVTFSALDAWMVSKNTWAPMSVKFDNQSMVVALLTVTNNNTSALGLKASDFWLDLGNGSWVQADDGRLNNNLPDSVASNTTVPFLLGFRGVENATPAAIVYWPDKGTTGDMISIELSDAPVTGPRAVLFKIGNTTSLRDVLNMTDNMTSDRVDQVAMELLLVGEGAANADIGEVKAWTLRNGEITGTVVDDLRENTTFENAKLQGVVFNVEKGDKITLITYQVDGVTRYIWLRPFMLPE